MKWLLGRYTLCGLAVIQGLFDPSIGMKRCNASFAIFSLTDSFQHNVLVTGGEDSKIITWRIQHSDLTDLFTPDQLDDPMESEVSNSKREWDDTVGDNQAGPVSNWLCATKNLHRPSLPE